MNNMNNLVTFIVSLVSSILKPRTRKIEMVLTFDNLLNNKFGWRVESDPIKDRVHVMAGFETHYVITPKGVKVSRGDDPRYYPASSNDPIWGYIEYK